MSIETNTINKVEDDDDDGGITILKPSMNEFIEFETFWSNMMSQKDNIKSGIIKIIPPKDWSDTLVTEHDVVVKNSLEQRVSGSDGAYKIENVPKDNHPIDLDEWIQSDKNSHLQSNIPNNLQSINDFYWENISGEKPVHSINNKGSFISSLQEVWNFNKLPRNVLLDIQNETLGKINKPVIDAGSWLSTLPWQVTPYDLVQICYLHSGEPKQWYSIPETDINKFEQLIKDKFPNDVAKCPNFKNHGQVVISPKVLKENNINFHSIIQYPNEIIILLPKSYHLAFNYGNNLVETIYYGNETWLRNDPSLESVSCSCIKHPKINIDRLKNYFKIEPELKRTTSTSTINRIQQQDISLRSTSPGPIEPLMNQSSISRVSSPFLSRMMDLSNIVEPTLEDPTMKFSKNNIDNKKRLLLQPRPMTLAQVNEPKSQNVMVQNQTLSPVGITSPQNFKDILLNQNNNNNTSTISTPTETRPNTKPTSALPFSFDSNEDNLLAMSLTSMANSGKSSPKLLRPLINSPTGVDFNNSPLNQSILPNTKSTLTNEQFPLRPLFTPGTSNNSFRPLSPFNSLLMNPNLNNNGIGSSNNSINSIINSTNPASTGITSNTMATNTTITTNNNNNNNININPTAPFLKRTKSSNIVTLNISREGSRSPGPIPQTQGSKISNDMPTSPLPRTMSPLYSNMLKIENNNNNINNSSNDTTKLDTPIKSTTNQQPAPKRQRKVKSESTNGSSGSSKFGTNEVLISEFGKVYVCQECNRTFSSGHHLTRHKKSVHSGEKPYSCPKCGKRFKRRDHVLQHLNKKIPCVSESNAGSGTNANKTDVEKDIGMPKVRSKRAATISPPEEADTVEQKKPTGNDVVNNDGIKSPVITN